MLEESDDYEGLREKLQHKDYTSKVASLLKSVIQISLMKIFNKLQKLILQILFQII